jgi:hypothetical protein
MKKKVLIKPSMETSLIHSYKVKSFSMDHIPKTFHSIPMHMNPSTPSFSADTALPPWHCNLQFLASSADPTSVFAIGLDDPSIDRFLFCASLGVCVKESLVVDMTGGVDSGFAVHHQRPYAMLLRQKNSSIGKFLHGLSLATSADNRIRAFMMADDGDEVDGMVVDAPNDDSVLTLVMDFDIDTLIAPIARTAGIILGNEEIERVSLRFEFSRTARAEHVAALALMMASHPRLGGESAIGRMLGTDMLRLVCDAYRLRLYECRRHVWSE